MTKYHGTPITPNSVLIKALTGRNALVSYAYPQNLKICLQICNKVIIDNGAFSIYNAKKKKGLSTSMDWNRFYKWLEPIHDKIEFFFIPDVIDGGEMENDLLIEDYHKRGLTKGVPIWHLHESFERLEQLIQDWDYIAFGSSGEYWKVGDKKWHKRMRDIMQVVCNPNGSPKVKIHMLRCLAPKIFTLYPFYSGDSTNLAQNHNRESKLKGDYLNGYRDGWEHILNRIDPFDSPTCYKPLRDKHITNKFKELTRKAKIVLDTIS